MMYQVVLSPFSLVSKLSACCNIYFNTYSLTYQFLIYKIINGEICDYPYLTIDVKNNLIDY